MYGLLTCSFYIIPRLDLFLCPEGETAEPHALHERSKSARFPRDGELDLTAVKTRHIKPICFVFSFCFSSSEQQTDDKINSISLLRGTYKGLDRIKEKILFIYLNSRFSLHFRFLSKFIISLR